MYYAQYQHVQPRPCTVGGQVPPGEIDDGGGYEMMEDVQKLIRNDF